MIYFKKMNPFLSQQGIYGKVLSKLSSEEMFFKKMTAGDKSEEEMKLIGQIIMVNVNKSKKYFETLEIRVKTWG